MLRLHSLSPLAVAVLVGGCMPFGDYQPAGEGAGGGGGETPMVGGGGGDVGGEGGGKICNPLDEENPNCADCVMNGLETDIDCGGDACGPCPLEAACTNDADCDSGKCDALACVPAPVGPVCAEDPDGNATCADCKTNGGETDEDCGGDACGPCAQGKGCKVDADCASGNCAGGSCGPDISGCEEEDEENPSCADCTENGSETDEDCGGDACPPCHTGKGCLVDADCVSGNCDGGTCGDPLPPECPTVDPDNPTCADCEMNGGETDVDCGGDACPPCAVDAACNGDADCSSEHCDDGVCS